MPHPYTAQVEAFERYHIQQQEERHEDSSNTTALPALGHAASGATGAAIANTITYPLSLIITRLQVQNQIARSKSQAGDVEAQDQSSEHVGYTDVLDAVRRIYAEEGGISAFYAGCLQDVGKSVLDSFLFFLAYNFIRRSRLQAEHAKRLPVPEEIAVGMVAGAFAKLVTTPMSNIVTRKQTASMFATQIDRSNSKDVKFLSTANIAKQIYKEKGLKGFWAGYSASLVLTINPSLTMLVHGALLRAVVPHDKRSAPGSFLTFLLAATSKALASSVTYPFQLAKSRLQVAGRVTSYDTSSSNAATAQKGIGEKLDRSPTLKGRTKKSTIISTVMNIAHEEGIMALYQGLPNELVKGFFQHGLTMLMKERVHLTVINLYSLLYTFMQTHPPPGAQTFQKARETVQEASSQATSSVQSAISPFQDTLKKPISVITDAANNATSALTTATNTAASALSDATSNATSTLSNATSSTASTLTGATHNALGSVAQPVSSHTPTVISNAASKASEELSQLGEASQRMLEEVAKRSQRSVGDVREKVKEMSDRVVDVMIELIKEGKNSKADFETQYVGIPGDDD